MFNLHLFGYYPDEVIVKDEGHQHEEDKEAYLLGHLPFFYTDGLSYYDLYQEKKDHSPVQDRHGKEV